MTEPVPPMPAEPSRVGDDLGLGITLPGSGTVDETGRRRVHPVTPLVKGARALPVGVILVLALGTSTLQAMGLGALAAIAVGLLLLPVVVAAAEYVNWRNTWYWFDADGDFRVDSGVLTRQQRRMQLSRLQSVDVTQPLFARLFSMAELKVEVAGNRDSRVTLQFLALDDARALRSEILARAAGIRHDSGEAPEEVIVTVPSGMLAVSLLFRDVTAGLILLTAVIVAATVWTSGWGGLVLALFTGGLPILMVVGEFTRYFNFTVSRSPDGLRQRFGLASTQTRTVPPGRVQSIEFVEPLLWRHWGWVRVRVNIAGVGLTDRNGNKEETILIPVATKAVAAELVERVLPGLDLDHVTWVSAPVRSRRRAPIQSGRLAVGWDAAVFVARRGRLTRRLAVIPHARTQSVRVTQGPWERSLGLASMHVDSTPGPVTITGLHLDALEARRVADAQAARAEAGRAADRSTRWAAGD